MVRHCQFARAKRSNERGIALIIALLSLLVLSVLAAAIIFVARSQILTSYNYKLVTQGRYAAETGAQNTINWLVYNYTVPTPAQLSSYTMTTNPVTYSSSPVVLSAMSGVSSNYPDSAQQTAFNAALNNKAVAGLGVTANYSTFAKLKRMQSFTQPFSSTPGLLQTWEITSQGTLSTINPTLVQVVETFENTALPTFPYALFAEGNTCGSLNIAGNTTTDSYDSSAGTYAATKQNNNGDIGSNGNVKTSTNIKINGYINTPQTNTISTSCSPMTAVDKIGSPTVTDTGINTIPAQTYQTLAIPATPTTAYTMPSTGMAPGTYGNATGSGTVHLSAGTYNFNSLCGGSGITFVVDSGPVIVKLGGNNPVGGSCNNCCSATTPVFDFSNNPVVINSGGTPSNFQMVYGGTRPITFEQGGTVYGLLYAPLSDVTYSSTTHLYGAQISKTINLMSNSDAHYDRSLSTSLLTAGSYRLVSFTWSKN